MAAKTHAERQAEYRDKQQVRARHFGHLNDLRQKALLESGKHGILDDKSPEAVALVKMFMALPLCHKLPWCVDVMNHRDRLNDDGRAYLLVNLPDGYNKFEAAAAYLALREISSLPIEIAWPEENAQGYDGDPEGTRQYVEYEVRQLRAAGVWWTEYPGTNIYDKRDA